MDVDFDDSLNQVRAEKLYRASLDRYFNWISIRSISKWNIVKFSGLFSLFGYMILFNSKLEDYFKLKFDQKPSISPFIMVENRLTLYFIGFILLSIFYALYKIYCPREIDENENVKQYAEKQIDCTSVTLIRRMEEIHKKFSLMYVNSNAGFVISHRFSDLYDRFNAIRSDSQSKTANMQYVPELNMQLYAKDALTYYFWMAARNSHKIRMIMLVLLILGAIFIIIPTADVTIAVFKRLYENNMNSLYEYMVSSRKER
jgi:hypothetical protein